MQQNKLKDSSQTKQLDGETVGSISVALESMIFTFAIFVVLIVLDMGTR